MTMPSIRPARSDEYDEVARVWMESWVSTGFGTASEELLDTVAGARTGGSRERLEPLCRRR